MTADPPCPFLSEPFIPEGRIERICSEALVAHGLMPSTPGAIRIDRFIEKQFGVEIEYDDLQSRFGDGVMGACRFARDGRVAEILVEVSLDEDESKLGEKRVRSTMAHEAGHGLLHGPLFVEKFQAEDEMADTPLAMDAPINSVIDDGFACRGLGSSRKGGRRYDWWEVQANMAMAALLLPRQLVDGYVREMMSMPMPKLAWTDRRAVLDLKDVAGMVADKFDVSYSMALYRIEALYNQMRSQPELL